MLLTEKHLRYPVEILVGILNLTNGTITGVMTLMRGTIDKIALTEDSNAGKSKLQISVSNDWVRLDKLAGRQNTVESQQRFFPSDLGFDHAAGLSDIKIKWSIDT